MELFNLEEFTKLAVSQPYDPNHDGLLTSLRKRYPHAEFNVVATRGDWSSVQKGLVDVEGRKISEDFVKWVTAEYDAMGQDARAVWEKYKNSGLMLTEEQGTTLYIASPFASSPEAFIQIEISMSHEVADRYAFDDCVWAAPDNLNDLIDPMTGVSDAKEISPFRYKFERMTNIRRFCQEMADLERQSRLEILPEIEQKVVRVVTVESYEKTRPLSSDFRQEVDEITFLEMFPSWLDRAKNEIRFIQDWQESSAGRYGARLCDHWFLLLRDYTDREGKRVMSFIPQWADADGGLDLPEITSQDRDDVYGAMSRIEKFNAQVGYPFAWYFYMLHGNRIDYTVGETVARGIQAVKISLAKCDAKVLMRWYEREYGF